jgi:hypothetical protein
LPFSFSLFKKTVKLILSYLTQAAARMLAPLQIYCLQIYFYLLHLPNTSHLLDL